MEQPGLVRRGFSGLDNFPLERLRSTSGGISSELRMGEDLLDADGEEGDEERQERLRDREEQCRAAADIVRSFLEDITQSPFGSLMRLAKYVITQLDQYML